MKMDSKLAKLMETYTDDVRHPLIVENPDWEEKITPALNEIGTLYDAGMLEFDKLMMSVRLMIEIAYVMGSQRREE